MNPKAGIRSTEFWLTAIIILLAVIGPKFGVELKSEQVVTLLTVSGVYTVGRAVPKAAALLGRKNE